MNRKGNRRYLGVVDTGMIQHDVFETCTGVFTSCGITAYKDKVRPFKSIDARWHCKRCLDRRNRKPSEYDGEWFYVEKGDKNEVS